MSDVNQQCVSLANGTISPDLRVNYEFGMVLGVDDFRQEQDYFLEKEYLYNRALHGYGTISGLHVTATRPPDNAHEVLITVGPGMGIDQWGRPIVVRNAQCARLGAWLANQQQQNPAAVASHSGTSGDMHIYVVASYDECPDALVPLPGQPCSSSDTTQAPSRIRDSYNIELRWDPPSMPVWDAVRSFAQLMATVQIVPGLPLTLSDEEEIIQQVRGLSGAYIPFPFPSPGSPPEGSPPEPESFLRLPAETAREALDRIFTVWTTEVRPLIAPDLIDPGTSEAGILLTTLDFIPATPFSTSNPAIVSYQEPDDIGRPYLLHTQLIQELLLLGEESQAATPANVEEFVTFNTVIPEGGGAPYITAWFHTSMPLALPSTLQATLGLPGASSAVTFDTSAVISPYNLWALTPPNTVTLQDKNVVSFSFDTDSILAGDGSTNLTAIIAHQQQAFLNYDGQHTIEAFYEVNILPAPPPPPPPPAPPLQFVTLTFESGTPGREIQAEIWFHLDSNPTSDAVIVDSLQSGKTLFLRVFAETANPTTPLEEWAVSIPTPPLQRNVYNVTITAPPNSQAQKINYLRFLFSPAIRVSWAIQTSKPSPKLITFSKTLGEYVAENHITFEGTTSSGIVAYLRIPAAG